MQGIGTDMTTFPACANYGDEHAESIAAYMPRRPHAIAIGVINHTDALEIQAAAFDHVSVWKLADLYRAPVVIIRQIISGELTHYAGNGHHIAPELRGTR